MEHTAWKVSVFGVILVHIFPDADWRPLFTQWNYSLKISTSTETIVPYLKFWFLMTSICRFWHLSPTLGSKTIFRSWTLFQNDEKLFLYDKKLFSFFKIFKSLY